MPRRRKSDTTADLSITWAKELPRIGRSRTSLKYTPIIEKLAQNPGKIALLASGLTAGSASSRVVSLREAAKRSEGSFKFPARRSVVDGTYSVFGVCSE